MLLPPLEMLSRWQIGRSALTSYMISHINLWNGNFLHSNSVDFWYCLISWRAFIPSWYCLFFFNFIFSTFALAITFTVTFTGRVYLFGTLLGGHVCCKWFPGNFLKQLLLCGCIHLSHGFSTVQWIFSHFIFKLTDFTQVLSSRLCSLFFPTWMFPLVFVWCYKLITFWPLYVTVVYINWSCILLSFHYIQIFCWENYGGHVWGWRFGCRCTCAASTLWQRAPWLWGHWILPITSITLITISCTTSIISMSTSSITVTKLYIKPKINKSNAVISHKWQVTQANNAYNLSCICYISVNTISSDIAQATAI